MRDRNPGHVRFSAFDLDLGTGELRKNGTTIRLQKQPFDVLALLLERSGELVTREELQDRIWGSDTHVDFDHGLNKAVKKIREALGDSADEPTYIETLARRGYRFVAPVIWDAEAPPQPPPGSAPQVLRYAEPGRGRSRWVAVLIAGLLTAGALGSWLLLRDRHTAAELKQRQITTNSADNLIESAILSPDGKYLLFGDQLGIHVRLIATGETHTFSKPDTLADSIAWFPTAWFPDGSRFIAVSRKLGSKGSISTSWSVAVLGGAMTLVRDDAFANAVSPDGSRIAFTTGGLDSDRDIWITGARGENPRRIAAGDDFNSFDLVQWSPTGRRVLYLRTHAGSNKFPWSLESRDPNGEAVRVVIPELYGRAGFCWLPDGRILYSVDLRSVHNENTNLWEIKADPDTGQVRSQPRRLTNWIGIHRDRFSFAAGGKLMAMQKSSRQLNVYVGRLDPAGRLQTPRRLTLEDSTDVPLAWTPDSKSVIFVSDRTGIFKIYKQAPGQPQAEPVTTDPDENKMVRLSPDGRWFLYMSRTPGETRHARLMRIPVSGGAPQVITETPAGALIGCPLAPATECILFEPTPDGKQTVLWTFDPIGGRHRELFRMKVSDSSPLCSVSTDGSQFACLVRTAHDGRIQFLSLTGSIKREINLKRWSDLNSIDWTPDGKMLVSSGGPGKVTLLRVDLDGRVQPVWERKLQNFTWGIASPDGRSMAVVGSTSSSNAWLLENF